MKFPITCPNFGIFLNFGSSTGLASISSFVLFSASDCDSSRYSPEVKVQFTLFFGYTNGESPLNCIFDRNKRLKHVVSIYHLNF